MLGSRSCWFLTSFSKISKQGEVAICSDCSECWFLVDLAESIAEGILYLILLSFRKKEIEWQGLETSLSRRSLVLSLRTRYHWWECASAIEAFSLPSVRIITHVGVFSFRISRFSSESASKQWLVLVLRKEGYVTESSPSFRFVCSFTEVSMLRSIYHTRECCYRKSCIYWPLTLACNLWFLALLC